jgi:hypothetical protein
MVNHLLGIHFLCSFTNVYLVDTSKDWLDKFSNFNSNRFVRFWIDLVS